MEQIVKVTSNLPGDETFWFRLFAVLLAAFVIVSIIQVWQKKRSLAQVLVIGITSAVLLVVLSSLLEQAGSRPSSTWVVLRQDNISILYGSAPPVTLTRGKTTSLERERLPRSDHSKLILRSDTADYAITVANEQAEELCNQIARCLGLTSKDGRSWTFGGK